MGNRVRDILGVLRPITDATPRQRRTRNLIQSVITSLGSRVLGMAITFFSVPLTIGYLGREQYGAWISIVSLTAWMTLTDFGLGHGLTNAVTTAAGQERSDLVRVHLSNGTVLMSAVAGASALVAAAIWPYVDWADVLGVHAPEARPEIAPTVAVVVAAFALNMPLSLAGKVYQAYQQGRIGNYWSMAGNVLAFVALVVVTQTHGGLVWLAIAISAPPLLLNAINNFYLFVYRRPELRPHWHHCDLPAMRTLATVGGGFFLSQLTGLVTYQTDNLVIDYFLGAAHVPEYNIMYSLTNYTNLPLSLVFPYMWVAYTEAIARKDISWVRRRYSLHLWAGFALVAFLSLLLIVVARPFVGWWVGEAVVPSMPLVLAMATWSIVSAFTNPIWCFLAASAHLKLQNVFSILSSIVNLVLSIVLVQRMGLTGVILATDIAYALCLCLPIYIIASRHLSSLEREQVRLPG